MYHKKLQHSSTKIATVAPQWATPRNQQAGQDILTLHTSHYWVEWDLMILDRIDTSINIADHLTKALQPTLFHCHADFLLGHVPPMYSPVYSSIIADFPNYPPNIDFYVPPSFTTPPTAVAAQVYTPLKADYQHNPWLRVIAHG